MRLSVGEARRRRRGSPAISIAVTSPVIERRAGIARAGAKRFEQRVGVEPAFAREAERAAGDPLRRKPREARVASACRIEERDGRAFARSAMRWFSSRTSRRPPARGSDSRARAAPDRPPARSDPSCRAGTPARSATGGCFPASRIAGGCEEQERVVAARREGRVALDQRDRAREAFDALQEIGDRRADHAAADDRPRRKTIRRSFRFIPALLPVLVPSPARMSVEKSRCPI